MILPGIVLGSLSVATALRLTSTSVDENLMRTMYAQPRPRASRGTGSSARTCCATR